jgi:hypothetical protein
VETSSTRMWYVTLQPPCLMLNSSKCYTYSSCFIIMTLLYPNHWLSGCICENHNLKYLPTWRLRHSVYKGLFLHDYKSREVGRIICKNKWRTMAVSRRALQWQVYASKWDWCHIFTIHILQADTSFFTSCQIQQCSVPDIYGLRI